MTEREKLFQAIELFNHEVAGVNEYDYGDYMRKVNLYLEELKDQVQHLDLNAERYLVEEKIMEIRGYLQYSPIWEIEPTKKRLQNDLQFLESWLIERPLL